MPGYSVLREGVQLGLLRIEKFLIMRGMSTTRLDADIGGADAERLDGGTRGMAVREVLHL